MRPRRLLTACVTVTAAVAAALLAAQAATAVPVRTARPQQMAPVPIGPVQLKPMTTTPHLLPTASPAQQVRQLVQCKGTMFAVGTFSTIEQGTQTYARQNAMSFKATSPFTVSSWAPKINGEVNSIAFNGSDCADAYIGGTFTKVNGTAVQYIAEISTQTGAVIKQFAHSANKTVDTLLGVGGRILAGGDYTTINGSKADPHMTALNPVTGADDGYLHLNISGTYQYPGVDGNSTRVYNQVLSNSGTLDLVMGDFTSVGGEARQQIFMLSLGKNKGTVTGWTSPEFDGSDGNLPGGYPYQCAVDEPFYIRAAAWAPNDQKIYLAATGYHPWNVPITGPRTGLCDSASAFPATEKSVLHLWVNYTGCDSLYSAAADMSTAYFGGHERWSENPDGCDAAGPGAIPAPGIEGLSPVDGSLTFNPTRARGLGADDMLMTSEGLWIASDDYDQSNACGGVSNLAGICLLPN
ncbi:MAG TPA: hypothetical protein VMA95_13025 [Streptosporangiaceae bacterium]|nr:hypothetical protein [Streptosporangiaceae bacterium]